MKPSNPKITISELGEQNTFVSGNKNWRIEWAEINGKRFEVGDTVKWVDDEPTMFKNKTYKGKIEWLIIIDDGCVEVSTDMPLGRLPVDEIKLVKKAK